MLAWPFELGPILTAGKLQMMHHFSSDFAGWIFKLTDTCIHLSALCFYQSKMLLSNKEKMTVIKDEKYKRQVMHNV